VGIVDVVNDERLVIPEDLKADCDGFAPPRRLIDEVGANARGND
jgi:hypothetical protein